MKFFVGAFEPARLWEILKNVITYLNYDVFKTGFTRCMYAIISERDKSCNHIKPDNVTLTFNPLMTFYNVGVGNI